MIVSRLPPSEPNGDVAAAVHTPAFKCFVSTALVDGHWETIIFSGDPAIDPDIFPVMRYVYPPDCDAHDAQLLNDLVATGFDTFAVIEPRMKQIGEHVAQTLIRKGIMIQVFWL